MKITGDICYSNDAVIKELLEAAGSIAKAHSAGDELGLTQEELAFYDTLTRLRAIEDFYPYSLTIATDLTITNATRGPQRPLIRRHPTKANDLGRVHS